MTDHDLIRKYGVPHDAHVQAWLAQDPERLAAFVEEGRRKNRDWETDRRVYRIENPHQKVGTGDGIRAPKN